MSAAQRGHHASAANAAPLCFGKLPGRGDFVRSPGHAALIEGLDQWQAVALGHLAANPRWKLLYDASPEVAFAVVAHGARVGLAGRWVASRDSSGRRFPLVCATTFEVQAPPQGVALSPLVLPNTWAALQGWQADLRLSSDPTESLARGPAQPALAPAYAQARLQFNDFLDTHTLASLQQALLASGHRAPLAPAVIALGLLLRPALAQGGGRLQRLLALPLTADARMGHALAAWWLLLSLAFFEHHDVELGVFLPQVPVNLAQVPMRADLARPPLMLLGFQGAAPAAVEAWVDPDAWDRHVVVLSDAQWVEDEVGREPALRRLATYLRDPGLSLSLAAQCFHEAFTGA